MILVAQFFPCWSLTINVPFPAANQIARIIYWKIFLGHALSLGGANQTNCLDCQKLGPYPPFDFKKHNLSWSSFIIHLISYFRFPVFKKGYGLPALCCLHCLLNFWQAKRLGALNKFKAGECNILICTDVASRGLDIPSVDMVINYDIPSNSKVRFAHIMALFFIIS